MVERWFAQRPGIDKIETFKLVARFGSLSWKGLLVELNLTVHQMDVATAYLNSDIDAEIYMANRNFLKKC